MKNANLGMDIQVDDSDEAIGPLVIEEGGGALAAEGQPSAKPVTLAPAPPESLMIQENETGAVVAAQDGGADGAALEGAIPVTQPGRQAAATDFGAVVPWASGAIVAGAALIAWALHSRAAAARAEKKVKAANAAAAGSDESLAQDMTELSDRLAAELDARAQRLERLIAAADGKIAELAAIEGRVRREPFARPAVRGGGNGHTEPKAAPVPVAVGAVESESQDAGIAAVYQMSDEGLTPVQIAQRTGKGTGQVELILNLRRAARGA